MADVELGSARPVGMLPRSKAFKEAKPENLEAVLDAAESAYPGVLQIGDLEKAQQAHWIREATRLLRDDKRAERWVAQLSGVLAPGVEAEAEDILRRREFDFANERRRIDLDEEDGRQGSRQEREIELKKWKMEEDERRSALKNRQVREVVVLVMAVIGFLLAVGVCIVGLTSRQNYVAGGSGGMALAILGVILHQVRQDQKQGFNPKAEEPKGSAS
jgi:hypothetical protein